MHFAWGKSFFKRVVFPVWREPNSKITLKYLLADRIRSSSFLGRYSMCHDPFNYKRKISRD